MSNFLLMRFLLMSRQYPASYLSLYEVCDQSWTLSSEGEIKTGSGPKLFSIFLVMRWVFFGTMPFNWVVVSKCFKRLFMFIPISGNASWVEKKNNQFLLVSLNVPNDCKHGFGMGSWKIPLRPARRYLEPSWSRQFQFGDSNCPGAWGDR